MVFASGEDQSFNITRSGFLFRGMCNFISCDTVIHDDIAFDSQNGRKNMPETILLPSNMGGSS